MGTIWQRVDKDGIRSYRRLDNSAVIEGEPGRYFVYLPIPEALRQNPEWVEKNGLNLKIGPISKLNKARTKADQKISQHYFRQLEMVANLLQKQKNENNGLATKVE